MKYRKDIPEVPPFTFWSCVMFNPQWFELPMFKTNFHVPKDFRATEVQLYFKYSNTLSFIHIYLNILSSPYKGRCQLSPYLSENVKL